MPKTQTILTKILIPLVLLIHFYYFYHYFHQLIPIRYWDEHAWIGRSYYFDLYLTGDINNPAWHNYYSYDQPKLGEYLYGLALYPEYKKYCKEKGCNYITFLIDHNFLQVDIDKYVQYAKNSSSFIQWGGSNFEDFDVSYKDLELKYGPEIEKTIYIIYLARKVNIYILSLNVIVVYALLKYVFGTKRATIVTFIYGLNPLLINAGLRAHSDALFVLLFNLSLLLIVYFFIKWHSLLMLSLISFTTALLTQTKLNGVMLFLFTQALILTKIFTSEKASKKQIGKLILYFAISSVIFITVFILINPYLFKNPVRNTLFLFDFRMEMMKKHLLDLNLQQSYIADFHIRIAAIYRNFFGTQTVSFFNTPIMFRTIAVNPYNSVFSLGAIFISLIGAIDIFTSTHSRKKQKILFLLIFVYAQVMMGFYLVVDWDRYYIHLVLFFSCLYVLGLYKILIKFTSGRI